MEGIEFSRAERSGSDVDWERRLLANAAAAVFLCSDRATRVKLVGGKLCFSCVSLVIIVMVFRLL